MSFDRLLDLEHPCQPAVSPDGTRVAFTVEQAYTLPEVGTIGPHLGRRGRRLGGRSGDRRASQRPAAGVVARRAHTGVRVGS